ncbi:MAG: aminotransferase class V-fold PLP-dependent enzyme [bacterium]|nr:aminotransferase class V-fold PLP-dependent enzyme [bacterium]
MLRRHFFRDALAVVGGAATLAVAARAGAKGLKIPEGGQIDPRDRKFWQGVRQQFPLTTKKTYLNTGGLGPSPQMAIDAVQEKMDALEAMSEVGHTHDLWQEIKGSAGRLLGCDADELVYTRNTTEGSNIVCNGLPLERGDEVITTTHEHVGNTIDWLARQRRDGIVVKTFTPSMVSAQENVERIAALITPRTKVLSLSHVTCATGQILPMQEIGRLAAAHGLWYFVDGAQSAGMMPVDVRSWGCHAYATSGHKWLLGPKGTGLLYVSRQAQDVIEPKFVGAYSAGGAWDMITTGEFTFEKTAQRYEYGTVNVPLFVGLGASMDFLLRIGMDNVWRHNHAMGAALKEGLNELGAEVLSPQVSEEHSSIITFRIANMPYADLQGYLSREHKLRTRGIYEGGLNGLRISLHLFNDFADVERVLDGVSAAMKA